MMNRQRITDVRRLIKNIAVIIFLFGIIFSNLNAQPNLQSEVRSYLTDIPFEMAQIQLPEFPDRVFNILDFGAVGDGHTLNTEAFKKAIPLSCPSTDQNQGDFASDVIRSLRR